MIEDQIITMCVNAYMTGQEHAFKMVRDAFERTPAKDALLPIIDTIETQAKTSAAEMAGQTRQALALLRFNSETVN